MLVLLFAALSLVSTLYFAVQWAREALDERFSKLIGSLPSGPVLLVTAHPDDESMFFVPIIRALQRAGHPVHCLCLSTGNWQGVGAARVGELQAAGHVLGLVSVTILDEPFCLADGPRHRWEVTAVEEALSEYLRRPGTPSFKLVLTFDARGVSGHPNHCDVSRGVRYALGRGAGETCVALLELQSTSWWQWKYLGPLAMVPALMEDLVRENWGGKGFYRVSGHSQNNHNQNHRPSLSTSLLVAVLSSAEYWRVAVGAMRKHRSQLLWFRYIYLASSAYLHLNTVIVRRIH